MVPRIIHQTWRDRNIPADMRRYVDTWPKLHPDWQVRLWTDDDLARLVEQEFPEFAELYASYPKPIERADIGRYLVLSRHGGVYADLDAEALRPFDDLLATDRPIFAEEPRSHLTETVIAARRLPHVLSNAVIVSPPGHPFWSRLLDLARACRHARNPLDATGPFLLTGAVAAAPPDIRPEVVAGYLFSPRDKFGQPCPDIDPKAPPLAQHHWHGTWFAPATPLPLAKRIKTSLRKARLRWQERSADTMTYLGAIDRDLLSRRAPADGSVLIAVPVRNAASTLDRLFEHIDALDYPRDKLSIAFLVGNSTDDSLARVRAYLERSGDGFRRKSLIERDFKIVDRGPRWNPKIQRDRRSRIARVRNTLLREALRDDDWVLWIDADVIGFPPDVLNRLLAERAAVVHPDSVKHAGGPSFDLNAWITEGELEDHHWVKYVRDGLYQPPISHFRLYLHDLRYLPRVHLDSVGGTMLLVDANIHRAGIVFPEEPYRRLIETEAFAAMARDLGVDLIGLPQVTIRHADA